MIAPALLSRFATEALFDQGRRWFVLVVVVIKVLVAFAVLNGGRSSS